MAKQTGNSLLYVGNLLLKWVLTDDFSLCDFYCHLFSSQLVPQAQGKSATQRKKTTQANMKLHAGFSLRLAHDQPPLAAEGPSASLARVLPAVGGSGNG